MSYIIPNATDVGGGLKYKNINQSEPDSLDIEALGLRANWLRSGGEVTASGGALNVAAGVAVINGVPYSFSAPTARTPTPATNARFDLVVARLTGGTVSVAFVTGTDSSTNPTLPKSRSVMLTGFDGNTCVDPATDVLLAAIYVDAGAVASANIVDKRIVDARPVTRTGTAVPTNQAYDVIGDIVIYGGVTYVKVSSTVWDQVANAAAVAAAGFPIGSIFAWPGVNDPNASQYKECDGSLVSKTTYPDLYAALKGGRPTSPYGESGGSFYLPKVNDGRIIVGDVANNIGVAGGSNTVTLSTANLPSHDHSVTVGNHSILDHSSVDATNHSGGVTYYAVNPGGAHYHTTQMHTHMGAVVYRPYTAHNGYHIGQNVSHTTDAFHVDVLQVNEENPGNPYGPAEVDAQETSEELMFISTSAPNTNSAVPSTHAHTFQINDHTISSHNVSSIAIGSGTSYSNQPLYLSMRWFIRVL